MAGLLDTVRQKIQQKAKEAVEETEANGLTSAINNVSSFYTQGNPTIYQRTGQLGNSAKSDGVSGGGNNWRTKIYLDVAGTSYNVPNPDFDFDGTGRFSHFSSQEVFEAAENHTSGVKGKPGFWKKTESELEQMFDIAMSKRFSKI